MVLISIFYGVTTPKYADIVRNVDDSREPMKKFMLSSLIFFRSRRDTKRHSLETVSAIWSHKGGKKRGFVVQFNRVERFRDIYNGEHIGILQERELFFDRRMVYTGLHITLFIVWLGSIHILMFPLGFYFNSMFDNQSVGCVTGLIVPLSQSLDNSLLNNFIELGHWNATSGSMDRCNTRVHFYVQRASEGLPTPWFEDIRVVLKDVLFSD